MNITLNADKLIDKITSNPWLLSSGILIALTAFFAYMYHTERMRTTVNCDAEIKKLREDYIAYQIQCNDDLIDMRDTHRKAMDSLETYYYTKLITLEKKLMRMEGKVTNLENVTNVK